jgi:aminopeptidase N
MRGHRGLGLWLTSAHPCLLSSSPPLILSSSYPPLFLSSSPPLLLPSSPLILLLLLLLLLSAFPCWDEPGVKATFTVSILLPAHLTALSNMPEVSSTHVSSKEGGGKEGDGSLWKRVVFDKSPKMSTYLLAWAIGEFDFVQAATKGGVAIRVYSPPGRGPQGQFALDVAVRSLDFYDDFFKTPYPLPKLDMICITEFAAGAMENWGLVTYRETALMVDEVRAQHTAYITHHTL